MDRFSVSAISLLVGLALIVLGTADVGASSSVSLIVGAALVLAPLLASIADQCRAGRPVHKAPSASER
jgi:hypothetical protein